MADTPPPVTLPGTECHALRTPGGEYRLFLAIPPGEPPPGGFPVLTVLEGNAYFTTVLDVLRNGAQRRTATGIGQAVVAGIAYPGDARHDQQRRTRDFTAGPSVEGTPRPTGGRDAFLHALLHQVRPFIAGRCAMNPARQVLIGHSLAGFFTLDVLAHDAEAFSDYVAVSPSVWWDEARLRGGSPVAGRRLAVSVGEWEQTLSPHERAGPLAESTAERRGRRAMVDKARGMAAHFAAFGVESRFWCFPEENHASVVPLGISRGLRFVLGE
ncbi:alpha/beta hydrolase-fold protein [Roseomonas sp. E05]|uniref:alpha/beta hydrolase n=1 Tax=Roseomonas sp. E05 TaxID=3046310 RepID=UPI0024B8EB10|nr:alpha/beta hydrolase-fold protein [Roseomonas sp. E05]MDJ0389490.1 alpha/beta hydrolase-fold protein [Roseomonas sp. E05]